MCPVEEGDKHFDAPRFLPEVARRLDQAFEPPEAHSANAVDIQSVGGAQIGERALDVRPVCVLGQIGAEDDFKGRLGRPPVLASPRLVENPIVAAKLSAVVGDGQNSLLMLRVSADYGGGIVARIAIVPLLTLVHVPLCMNHV